MSDTRERAAAFRRTRKEIVGRRGGNVIELTFSELDDLLTAFAESLTLPQAGAETPARIAEAAWISVDERVPKGHETVLVYRESGTIAVGWHHCKQKRWYYSHTNQSGSFSEQFVTHWQPLPAPPASVPEGESQGGNGNT
jgi:hypothetical protein